MWNVPNGVKRITTIAGITALAFGIPATQAAEVTITGITNSPTKSDGSAFEDFSHNRIYWGRESQTYLYMK